MMKFKPTGFLAVFSVFFGLMQAAAASDTGKGKLRVAIWIGKGSDWPNFSAGALNTLLGNSTTSKGSAIDVTLLNDEESLSSNLTAGSQDVMIFPGGSAPNEDTGLGAIGTAAVKTFLDNGGGYVGICAGAYLARPKFLAIVNYTIKTPWARGDGEVQISFNDEGRSVLGLTALAKKHDGGYLKGENATIHYGMGPIFNQTFYGEEVDYTVLATYLTEISNSPSTKGEMVGTPAIVTHRYPYGKRGRILLSSPHPELTGTLPGNQGEDTIFGHDLVIRYLEYAAGWTTY